MRKYLLGIAAAAVMMFTAHSAAATPTSACPDPTGGNSGGEGVSGTYSGDVTLSGGAVTNNTSCNVLVTFNANGSITTTHPNAAGFYDAGGDDNLVGIINNSGQAITSLVLSSASTAIFGFEFDGICGALNSGAGSSTPGYTFLGGGNPCGVVDTTGYGDNGITFSGINGSLTSGTVNFAGTGIAAGGGTAFFSLEGPVDVNLAVNPTPEPGTLVLFMTGLLGMGGALRRKLNG